MQSSPQKIIWPWQTKQWPEMKAKFIDSKFTSIVDMDSKIASISGGKLRPKMITELFNQVPELQTPFINNILPWMQQILRDAPRNFRDAPAHILPPNATCNIAFTRMQILTIIVCMWFGLFNYNYITRGLVKLSVMPEPSFANVFIEMNLFAFQCILGYFQRMYACQSTEDNMSTGMIIIKRVCMGRGIGRRGADVKSWQDCDTIITEDHIALGSGLSDESMAKMFVGYSSEIIGGDEPIKSPLSQECIIMLTRPECLVALLMCVQMESTDAIVILGAEKISAYSGYGNGVKYLGEYHDTTPYGYSSNESLLQSAIIFIDASNRSSQQSQLRADFMRDLNKAYVGMSALKFSHMEMIASGNWSYKFIGSNMQVKFIQQLLACVRAGHQLVYYPFAQEFEDRLVPFINWILANQLTCGEVFNMYLHCVDQIRPNTRMADIDIFLMMTEL